MSSLTVTILLWTMFGVSLTAIVYSQIVYPLLMVLASRRSARSPVIAEWPTVTLIIPAHNESAVIAEKLENSLAIDYPAERLEIIVASDGSDDATVRQARAFEDRGVMVLDLHPRRGKAAILNDAVAESRGEILCLCDANVMFRDDAIRRMVAHFGEESIGAVTGDVRLESDQSDYGEGESLYYRIERAIQLGESRVSSLVCVDGGMYVLRRELFRPLTADVILDDLTTTLNVVRQGKRVLYEPSAVADENATPHWRAEYRRRVRTTIGAVQSMRSGLWPPISRPVVLWQYASHKPLRWFGPIWLLALLVSSAMLWPSGPLLRAAVVFQAVLYVIAMVATFVPPLRRTHVGGVLFYFVMSHLAMAEGLIRGLARKPTGIWPRTRRIPRMNVSPSPVHPENQGKRTSPRSGTRQPNTGSQAMAGLSCRLRGNDEVTQ